MSWVRSRALSDKPNQRGNVIGNLALAFKVILRVDASASLKVLQICGVDDDGNSNAFCVKHA